MKQFKITKAGELILFIIVITVFYQFSCSSKKESGGTAMKHAAIVMEEFIYEISAAPTPQCHASTIAETQDGFVAAWFGGTEEKNKDVGIWISRHTGDTWSKPAEVVNGIQDDGTRYPCWNPVLFQPKGGSLILFYKVGPSPSEWWGRLTTSADGGQIWSSGRRLPDGILGPIKNKPVMLANGDLLCPSSTEHDDWKVYMEHTSDLGKTWSISNPLNDGKTIGAIQPTILTYKDNRIQVLCRTENGFISECWSEDNGKTWDAMQPTDLPNPNSGIDGVTLNDGRQLLVYNPTAGDWGARVPLSIAVSKDGKDWKKMFDLEPVTNPQMLDDEEYSYPAVIQASNGMVHVVYTYNRKTVKHVIVDPNKI